MSSYNGGNSISSSGSSGFGLPTAGSYVPNPKNPQNNSNSSSSSSSSSSSCSNNNNMNSNNTNSNNTNSNNTNSNTNSNNNSSSNLPRPPNSLLAVGDKVSATPNFLVAHSRQRNNELMKHVKCKFGYSNELTYQDFVLTSTCILYLSSTYHVKNEEYIKKAILGVGNDYPCRILLLHIDNDCDLFFIRNINVLCAISKFTLILAWSYTECAKYIESLVQYEGKPSTIIQEKNEQEFLPRVTKCLLNVKSVNKTDVGTLLEQFGDFKTICTAKEEQLACLPGFGEKKSRRFHQVMNFPLNANAKNAKKAKTKGPEGDAELNFKEQSNSSHVPSSTLFGRVGSMDDFVNKPSSVVVIDK